VSSRRATLIALVGVGAWLAMTTITWLGRAPLGHDESQYALAAKDLLAGDPARWFYLSRGMNAIAVPGVLLGGGELALRFLPLLLGAAFIVAMYWLGRRTVGATSAAWAILVLGSSRTISRLGTDLLSDMPAAALLLAAFAILVDEVDRRDGPRWRILCVAPLLAAAFYVRYGSVIPIAVMVVCSLVVGARSMLRRPLPVIATAALFLVLLVPHFLEAKQLSGSALGILLWSRAVPNQGDIPSGLTTYLTSNPFRYYGLLTPLPLVAGVLAFQVRDKRRLLAWLVGIGSFVAMGLTTHGMLRYILVPVAILVVLGTDLILRGLVRVPGRARTVVSGVLVLALVVVWALNFRRQLTAGNYRRDRLRGALVAAEVIRADAAGRPCSVLGHTYTQLEWYSGCNAPLILAPQSAAEALAAGRIVYLVRDHTPSYFPKWNPVFAEMPGAVHVLVENADVEVARLSPPGT
jgi:4-amino-4-deoxy-L-arabinose transferase-like glycosyltransferase